MSDPSGPEEPEENEEPGTGPKASVYLVLERSSQMIDQYQTGQVQNVAERVIDLVHGMSNNGRVKVVMFDHNIKAILDLVIGQHYGAIDAAHQQAGAMSGVSYEMPIEWTIGDHLVSGSMDPAFVAFHTLGTPHDPAKSEMLLSNATRYPIKWDFHGWGSSMEFLHDLDRLNEDGQGLWDNVSLLELGSNPPGVSDEVISAHMQQSLTDAVEELNGPEDES